MARSRVLRILTSVMAGGDFGRTGLLHRMCVSCAVAIPADGVALVLPDTEGMVGLVAATGHRAGAVQELEATLTQGPARDAFRDGRPVLQPQLRQTGPARWPEFGPAALDNGIEAIFAFPLHVGGIRLGVLALYRTQAGVLTPVQTGQALSYADAAVTLLLHLQDQTPPSFTLQTSLLDSGRAEVHEATGMIAVMANVGITEGLLMLLMHASASQRSVVDVAVDVVGGVVHFAEDPRRDDDAPDADAS